MAMIRDEAMDAVRGAGHELGGFKKFILRGNVVDLAVGIVIGAAFTGVVQALVKDIITPLIGIFGGNVAALKLNIDFADHDLFGGAAPTPFGNLLLCGFPTLPGLNGMTVRQFLALANTSLGGGSTPYTADVLSSIASALDNSFVDGTVSVFAQDHLFSGNCPP